MNRRRIWIPVTTLLFSIGAIWLLWVRPKPVDMAQFAPAHSLIYIEVNEPVEVLKTLARTDAWKLLNQHLDAPMLSLDSRWQTLLRVTGLGPIDSVILSRSQVALVVTSLGSKESGDVLSIKPEAALIVETHTSERRIRVPIERHLERLASTTLKIPRQDQRVIDGVRTVNFQGQSGSGQLIAAFVGSVVVIGNSKTIVDSCVGVVRRRAPSLRSNPDLQSARVLQGSANELAFGFIPSEGSAKLLSTGVPIFLGQSPADSQFQRLVQNAASELIGGVTWTLRSFRGGVEDHYTIDLKPNLVTELKPHFGAPEPMSTSDMSAGFYSITSYRLESPLATWQQLRTSISRRVDTVAAVVVNTMLKTSLSSYGIDDPETFLSAVKSPLKTIRLDHAGERQLLVATLGDRSKLIDLFRTKMPETRRSRDGSSTLMENSERTLLVALNDFQIVIGHPVDVQQYFRMTRAADAYEQSPHIANFVNSEGQAHIVTYANDSERIGSVASTIARMQQVGIPSALSAEIDALPFATTETTLTDRGLTRITRSPLGQFSSVIPLLAPSEGQQ